MKHLFSAGLLVVGLSAGIVIGKATSRKPSDPEQAELDSAEKRTGKRERSSRADSPTNNIDRIRKAKPGDVGGLTALAASSADPIEKQRLVSECLLHMTAENWREVVGSFDKISKESGRDAAELWKLSMFRSGQVAGEEVMNEHLTAGLKNRKQQSWEALYGWGTKDPRGALEWLKKAEANGHETNAENYSAIIAGAALSNPDDALKLLAQVPADRRGGCAGHLTWNIVQNSGTGALDGLLEYASKLDKSDPQNEEFADNLLDQTADKLLWKADHALDVQQACEVVSKLVEYGEDPTAIASRALQKYRWYGMPEKLRLLNTVNSSNKAADLNLPMLTSFVLGTMNGDGDKVAVIEWMNKNPDSPLVPLIEKRVPRNQ